MRKLIAVLLLCIIGAFAPAAFATTTYKVNLTWTPSITPSVNYNIYRESAAGACSAAPPTGSTCTLVNATPSAPVTFTDTGVSVNNVYFYVVRAVNATGIESVNSGEVKADLTQPATPGGVNVTVTVTVTIP